MRPWRTPDTSSSLCRFCSEGKPGRGAGGAPHAPPTTYSPTTCPLHNCSTWCVVDTCFNIPCMPPCAQASTMMLRSEGAPPKNEHFAACITPSVPQPASHVSLCQASTQADVKSDKNWAAFEQVRPVPSLWPLSATPCTTLSAPIQLPGLEQYYVIAPAAPHCSTIGTLLYIQPLQPCLAMVPGPIIAWFLPW